MNITALTIKMMLNLTARWLADQAFRDHLMAAGALGKGILDQLTEAHDLVAELASKRSVARKQIRALIDRCIAIDQRHDRKARALYQLITGLMESTDDELEVEQYRDMRDLLFPIGLRVVQLPYIEEGGAAVETERSVSLEMRARMAAIQVGGQTLEQVFDDWMAAAHELGEAVRRRAEVQAALSREGSHGASIDMRVARRHWLQAARGLLWAIDVRPELRGLAEPVEAALAAADNTAQRRRNPTETETELGDGDDDGDAGEENEVDDDTDDDAELDDDTTDGDTDDAALIAS